MTEAIHSCRSQPLQHRRQPGGVSWVTAQLSRLSGAVSRTSLSRPHRPLSRPATRHAQWSTTKADRERSTAESGRMTAVRNGTRPPTALPALIRPKRPLTPHVCPVALSPPYCRRIGGSRVVDGGGTLFHLERRVPLIGGKANHVGAKV